MREALMRLYGVALGFGLGIVIMFGILGERSTSHTDPVYTARALDVSSLLAFDEDVMVECVILEGSNDFAMIGPCVTTYR